MVRAVSASGTISTFAGTGTAGSSGDGGQATAAELNNPLGVAVGPSGNVYISDTGNCVVREVSAATGIISTVAGKVGACGYTGNGGLATAAELNSPVGIALDQSGNLYIADQNNCVIRRVSARTGDISTVAGTGTCSTSTSGGPPTSVSLNDPYSVALDGSGDLFISTLGGTLWELPAASGSAYGTTLTAGSLSPIATGLPFEAGVTVDAAGNVYLADFYQNTVEELSPSSSTLTTYAGTPGTSGESGNGGLATNAQLDGPVGVAVTAGGNLLVSDYSGHVVRKITQDPSGVLALGSVCLWATFDNGWRTVSAPFCNTSSPNTISISQFAPNPADSSTLLPVPVGTPLTLSVDDPNGTCPYISGMEGRTSSGWASLAVCTSWTWGPPAQFGELAGTLSSFSGTTLTLQPGQVTDYRAVWSGASGGPADGVGSTSSWALPRLAQNCASDATCVPMLNVIPEQVYCSSSNKMCLS